MTSKVAVALQEEWTGKPLARELDVLTRERKPTPLRMHSSYWARNWSQLPKESVNAWSASVHAWSASSEAQHSQPPQPGLHHGLRPVQQRPAKRQRREIDTRDGWAGFKNEKQKQRQRAREPGEVREWVPSTKWIRVLLSMLDRSSQLRLKVARESHQSPLHVIPDITDTDLAMSRKAPWLCLNERVYSLGVADFFVCFEAPSGYTALRAHPKRHPRDNVSRVITYWSPSRGGAKFKNVDPPREDVPPELAAAIARCPPLAGITVDIGELFVRCRRAEMILTGMCFPGGKKKFELFEREGKYYYEFVPPNAWEPEDLYPEMEKLPLYAEVNSYLTFFIPQQQAMDIPLIGRHIPFLMR